MTIQSNVADANGLPPALTEGDEWQLHAGVSATVLVRDADYQQEYRPARYFHRRGEWRTELNPNNAANVVEWWPMPPAGTGIKPKA